MLCPDLCVRLAQTDHAHNAGRAPNPRPSAKTPAHPQSAPRILNFGASPLHHVLARAVVQTVQTVRVSSNPGLDLAHGPEIASAVRRVIHEIGL